MGVLATGEGESLVVQSLAKIYSCLFVIHQAAAPNRDSFFTELLQ